MDNTFPTNVTYDDLCICPHCECNGLFYIADGHRLFCAHCKKEVRNNRNFQEGMVVDGNTEQKEGNHG